MTWTLINGDFLKTPLPTPKPGQRVVVIQDPPYSPRTHEGRRTGSSDGGYKTRKGKSHAGSGRVSEIGYQPLTRAIVKASIKKLLRLKPEWWVIFGDITGLLTNPGTIPWWGEELAKSKQYCFPPLPWNKPDAAPRKSGEGPDSQTEWLMTADHRDHRKELMSWLSILHTCLEFGVDNENARIMVARHMKRIRRYGNRDGAYFDEPTASTRGVGGKNPTPGQKPLTLLRKLVLAYSEPGDLVIDPFAGTGTTLLAAVMEGRDAWGCEIDAATHKIALGRLKDFDAQGEQALDTNYPA